MSYAKARIFQDARFNGFYLLLGQFSRLEELDESTPATKQEPIPVLGFTVTTKPSFGFIEPIHSIYENDRFKTEEIDMLEELIPTSQMEPLCIKFSNLNTPNKVADFANFHGSLFGEKSKIADFATLKPITKKALMDSFGLKRGQQTSRDVTQAQQVTKSNQPVFYEKLDDWILESKKVGFALALSDLAENMIIESAFKLSNQGVIKVRNKKGSRFVDIVVNYSSGQVKVVEKVFADGDTRARRQALRKPIEFNAKRHRFEFDGTVIHEGALALSVSGKLESSLSAKDNEHIAKMALLGAFDGIVNHHLKEVTVESLNGEFVYLLDTLSSYLWLDCLTLVNGVIPPVICGACGSIYFRHNRSKEYCNNRCGERYRYRNEKTKPQKEKSDT